MPAAPGCPRLSRVWQAACAAASLAAAAAAAGIVPPSGPVTPRLAAGTTPGAGHRAVLTDSQCVGYSASVTHGAPWAQQQLDPSAVWAMTQGAGQVVAVLDQGVSASAPALAGAVLPGTDTGSGEPPADTDCFGHGTFVAGLIAARPTSYGFAGVAPKATILPVNVVNSDGSVTAATVAAGISYAVDNGATIIDFSAAATPAPSAALSAAVANALASNVVVIGWVSNSASNINTLSFPADCPGALAVTAVDPGGAPLMAGAPGVPVSLAAPGDSITSIGPAGPGEQTGSGASLATGFVAGVAALVRSYYPRLTAAQVVQRLEATATNPGTALPDSAIGYGVVSPYEAVTAAAPADPGSPPSAQAPLPRVPPPAPADHWPLLAAVIVCCLAGLALVACAASVHIVRQGRSRGWRPPAHHWQ
jgi:membrane-anchored mycosin MYCP